MQEILDKLRYALLCFFELLHCIYRYFLIKPGSPFKPPIPRRKADKNEVLKRTFKPERVPCNLDVIVIGSGISGLGVAALLANVGRKVLVLEQHDRAGGCTHTFEDSGFEFDVGLHYVGRLADPVLPFRTLMDTLTNGEVEWDAMDKAFEEIQIGDETYHMEAGSYWKSLEIQFPQEVEVIDEYRSILSNIGRSRCFMIIIRVLPTWLNNWLISVGFFDWVTSFFVYARKSTTQVLTEIGASPTLQSVLAYAYLNSGSVPDRQSFVMHALMALHYIKGGYYPRGGSAVIAASIIQSIVDAGGEVLVRANVKEILTENGRAVGVSVQKGSKITNLYAPVVVSSVGVQGTFEKLLPRELSETSRYFKYVSKLGPCLPGLSVFVGLEGTAEEFGLKNRNYWFFSEPDLTKSFDSYVAKSFDEALTCEIPAYFVSFPSTKDSTWNETREGRSTCVVLTFVNYEWFALEDAESRKAKQRGQEYEFMKKEFGHYVWQQVLRKFPQLEGKEIYFEIGTPLTNNFYYSSTRGEFYGLDHSIPRFTAQAMSDLRPQTDIDGLYLTGQDIFVCGVSGAAYSALLTVTVLLKRSGFFDLFWTSFKRRMSRNWGNATS